MKQRVSKCSLNKVGKSMINRLYTDYRMVHLLSAMTRPYQQQRQEDRVRCFFFSPFVFASFPSPNTFLFPPTTLSLFISLVSRNRNIFLSLKITHDANAPGIIGRICSRR